jgi:glutathione synthase
VKCEFLTLHDIAQFSVVGDNDRHLTIKVPDSQSFEVSVAYFRAGYTPNDYPTEEEWKARELIEKSKAIKCPSVGYHLAGTKAIQAALCKPGILERFLSTEECEELRLCFAEQYSLGDEETKDACRVAFDAASQDGSGWVLKPQREGGGNNYYNENLSQFLSTHKDDPILSG